MSGLGLGATELGPEGFLPRDPIPMRDLLASNGLAAVAGFVPLVLHRPDRLDAELAKARRAADVLAAAGASVLVLAADTAEHGYEVGAEPNGARWAALVRGLDSVVDIGAERSLIVALHPHVGTMIERPAEVGRLLESSTVALTLDTGHLFVGGADPVDVARTAAGRVAHVHLKDADGTLASAVRKRRLGYRDAVSRGMYRPLGTGDVDVAAVIRTLEASGYRGWYVLEQDTVLQRDPEPGTGPVQEAAASLAFIGRVADELDRPVRADAWRG
jgi:inosose dehydratase